MLWFCMLGYCTNERSIGNIFDEMSAGLSLNPASDSFVSLNMDDADSEISMLLDEWCDVLVEIRILGEEIHAPAPRITSGNKVSNYMPRIRPVSFSVSEAVADYLRSGQKDKFIKWIRKKEWARWKKDNSKVFWQCLPIIFSGLIFTVIAGLFVLGAARIDRNSNVINADDVERILCAQSCLQSDTELNSLIEYLLENGGG